MQRINGQYILGFAALVAIGLSVAAQPVPPAVPAPTPAVAAAPQAGGELPPLTLPTVAQPTAQPQPTAATAPAGAEAGLPQLPAVTSTGASSPVSNLTKAIANATSNGTTAVVPDAATPKQYSFGDSDLSILFLPDQIKDMKDAIRTFEDSGRDAAPPVAIVPQIVSAPVEEKIDDPATYPVFYLASIAYDAPNQWSLWLSGYKITSHRNDTDVTVLSVSRDSATFMWAPSFAKAIGRRQRDKLFAPTDPVKNKLAGVQRASFDAATGAVTFTLRQNQTFAVGYFRTFEGYIDAPTLTALPVAVPAANDISQSQPLEGPPPTGDAGFPDANANGVPPAQNAAFPQPVNSAPGMPSPASPPSSPGAPAHP